MGFSSPQSLLLKWLKGLAMAEIVCIIIFLFYMLYGLFAWEELPPTHDEPYLTNSEVFILLVLVALFACYCLIPVFMVKKTIAQGVIPSWIVISVAIIEIVAMPLIVLSFFLGFYNAITPACWEIPFYLSTIMAIVYWITKTRRRL